MQRSNLLKLIMALVLLIVIIVIAIFVFTPEKVLKSSIEEIKLPPELILPIQPEKENESLQIPLIPGEQKASDNIKTSSAGAGGGGGLGGETGSPSMSNDLPFLQVCPSSLNVEYLIDYKQTVTPTDDDVYLGIRNNNQLPEFIGIKVDDLNEGTLQINGLGLSVLKSLQITSWWRPLNLQTQKTFSVLLTPESCQPISSTVTVSFPPSEGDYLD